jgi:hypothetical protein
MTEPNPGRWPQRLRCRLLQHRWTRWQPKPAGSCHTLRDCLRCGARESSASHDWGKPWAYDRDGACEGRSTCTRCDARLPVTTTRHVYEWAYDEPGRCDAHITCTRCRTPLSTLSGFGTVSTRTPLHRRRWEYDAPGRCAGQDRCTRCGDTTAETERHDYHWLVAATEHACRDGTCRRCAATVTQAHDYRWASGPAQPPAARKPGTFAASLPRGSLRSCVQRYECANCGRVEPGQIQEAHSWRETISSDGVDRECDRCGARDY